ncbi:Ankyrin repeat-containing [Hyphodiscus hymeniophilus]|uniref:Ankyrin repeat-containing n=1 Tax=Hyphodiscus hymeniophilus TaxID=353542 RepID=A0A9P7AZS6_9HELO|nr:Ankyrin repeat-containing [Hyphodiscus hymeniophilus]
MADPRIHPEQDDEHEGASPSELLIEAARRNNTDLLQQVIDDVGDEEKSTILLNETKTVLGNYLYHEAALRGNYEIIDMLLDQEGFECDPINRMEGDTPLHSAVRYINSLDVNPDTAEEASSLIGMMCEAGNDPRIKNKANLTPYQLTDPRNSKLRQQLMDAVDMQQNHGDFINADEAAEEEFDDDYAGSGSDSDFDPEEFKKEQARRKEEKEKMRMEGQKVNGDIGQAI